MKITENIKYIGVNDHKIDFFERQFQAPHGMSYNSYVILDEKVAVFDTVDANFTHEWLQNLKIALDSRTPDYLIIQHMEPDHSANIESFLNVYPNAKIVASAKGFGIMDNFFCGIDSEKKLQIADGETLNLGKHHLTFISAPMVHWPEVIFTYESHEKILFSADAFGKFGALDIDDGWDDEARRYYFGIVGKYGVQVQNALAKATKFEIKKICPLHGFVLDENINYYIGKYRVWSSYAPEEKGIVIAYTSIYGNTKKAVVMLANTLAAMGCDKVIVLDLTRVEWSEAVASAFRYSKLVLATTTYNSSIFPHMRHFIDHLRERNFQNRTIGFIENGSWAPTAQRVMKTMLSECKNLTYLNTTCTIHSTPNDKTLTQLTQMAEELLNL